MEIAVAKQRKTLKSRISEVPWKQDRHGAPTFAYGVYSSWLVTFMFLHQDEQAGMPSRCGMATALTKR